jgi:branched-chain amino acid transport system ATP-binding protein
MPREGLVVRDLVVRYGAAAALGGVSVEAKPGRITCVLGRNGAGKSTLLRAIMGLVRPASGEVSFDGRALDREPAWTRPRRGLALVPEASGVIARMSVLDNLRLGAFQRRLKTAELGAEIDRVVELFPVLGRRLRSPAGTLSGGERQMLALARTLLAQPTLILLDEPSFGLAPLVVEQVLAELRGLAEQGYGVLLSEQNAAAALALADDGYVLDRGRVAFRGVAADLRGRDEVDEVLFA